MVAFAVGTHTKNTRQHTDSFNIQYLSHEASDAERNEVMGCCKDLNFVQI